MNRDWTNADNWSPVAIPGTNDSVIIPGNTTRDGPRQQTAITVDKITFSAGATQDVLIQFADWDLDKANTTFIEVETGNTRAMEVDNSRSTTPQIQITAGTNTVLNNGSGSLTLSGNNSGNGGIRPVNAGSGSYNLVFNGTGTTIVDPNFTLENNGTRELSLTKLGVGALFLNSDSTYTGDTQVNGGTFGGAGTVGGSMIVLSGAITPGESAGTIGTLDVDGSVLWNSSDAWIFELGAGNTADLLAINDDFVLFGGGVFDFADSTALGTFDLVTWDGTSSHTADEFTYINLGGGNTGEFQITGNTLQIVVVPEPSSWALGLLAFGAWVGLRRRR